MDIDDDVGIAAVQLARNAVESYVKGAAPSVDVNSLGTIFKTKMGAFVTLKTYPENELRGCIGYPLAIYPLYQTLIRAAKSAALEDPRFPPVRTNELEKIVIETTILTPLELIKGKKLSDFEKQIEIGVHGLEIELGFNKGLLLPQVPIEQKWNVEEFLENTCWKAGLTPDSYLDERAKLYRFSGVIFGEEKPKGTVKRVKLKVEQ